MSSRVPLRNEPARGMSVLVAHPEPGVRNQIVSLIRSSFGCDQVMRARDGAEVIRRQGESHPDIMFLATDLAIMGARDIMESLRDRQHQFQVVALLRPEQPGYELRRMVEMNLASFLDAHFGPADVQAAFGAAVARRVEQQRMQRELSYTKDLLMAERCRSGNTRAVYENQYYLVLDMHPDPILIVDRDARMIYANSAARSQLGCTARHCQYLEPTVDRLLFSDAQGPLSLNGSIWDENRTQLLTMEIPGKTGQLCCLARVRHFELDGSPQYIVWLSDLQHLAPQPPPKPRAEPAPQARHQSLLTAPVVSAAEYLRSLEFNWQYEVPEIEDACESIQDDSVAFVQYPSRALLHELARNYSRFATALHLVFAELHAVAQVFSRLSSLANSEQMHQILGEPENCRRVALFIDGIAEDIENWVKAIFLNQDARDIRYLDDALTVTCNQLEMLVHQPDQLEQETADLELF